jgi:hypothetical protein
MPCAWLTDTQNISASIHQRPIVQKLALDCIFFFWRALHIALCHALSDGNISSLLEMYATYLQSRLVVIDRLFDTNPLPL